VFTRSRRLLLTATALCALAVPASAASADGESLACHDFMRFHERWEHCVAPDGSVEVHRVGVLFEE
jgi:hypothetical protein